MSKQNVAFLKKMTDEQLLKYYNKRKPAYRRLISKFTSLMKLFKGKVFGKKNLATASEQDVIADVSGRKGTNTKTSGQKGGKNAGFGLIVQKVDTPGPRVLKQYIDGLDSRQAIDELEAMIERFSESENKSLNKLVPNLNRERDALIDAYTESLQNMSDVADNHMPDAVGDLFKRVQKYFDGLDADYIKARDAAIEAAKKAKIDPPYFSDAELDYYINVGIKNDVMDFVLNCDISHWPAAGVVGRAKVVVVTARLTPTDDAFEMKAYVSIHDKVGLPGLYSIGSELKGNDTAALAKELDKVMPRKFAVADVVAFAAPVELDLDATEVTTRLSAIEGVTGVNVDSTEVTIEYPDNDREIQAQVLRVMGAIPSIKRMLNKEYTPTLRTIDPGVHTYSLTLKD
jgi:hypothetical protein